MMNSSSTQPVPPAVLRLLTSYPAKSFKTIELGAKASRHKPPPSGDLETSHIIVPLQGVDLQSIHVLVSPWSILIEIRTRKRSAHGATNPVHTEVETHRISRELQLRECIRRGATLARMVGDALHLTVRKATTIEEGVWSEWIRFDTRASLGCV